MGVLIGGVRETGQGRGCDGEVVHELEALCGESCAYERWCGFKIVGSAR